MIRLHSEKANARRHYALRCTRITALLLTLVVARSAHAEVLEYSFLTAGKPSGSEVVERRENGETRILYSYNDRGRGPDTESIITLNADGTLKAFNARGKNYRKGAVDESFAIEDGSFRWHSNSEAGNASTRHPAFYLPLNTSPEIHAMLARALLKAKDQEIALLPSGKASISKVETLELQQGGESLSVTLYSISGIATEPRYVWLDQHGNNFGVDYGWFAVTRKGWEQHADTLKQHQAQATDAYYGAFAKQHTQLLDGRLAIRGARIFDSHTGQLTAPATVFIWEGKISAIYFSEVEIPAGTELIEATGKTLMPALWDMHAHVSVESFPNYLASGVTAVRDMANDALRIEKLARDTHDHRVIGPEVFPLGFIDKQGEFAAPTGTLAARLEDALGFVDYYAQRGHVGIKLYSSIEPEWVEPIASYAHERGLVVMGHVPAYMNAQQAIEAGYDEITHINMVLLNFLGAEDLDTRTPVRFIVPGEHAGQIDLDSGAVQEFIALMREQNIAVDPTLSIFINMFRNTPGEVLPSYQLIADTLPASKRRELIASPGFNQGKEAEFAAAANRTMELVRRLHEAGIRLLPGTDADLPGFTLIQELIYYAEAGIPANEVLQLATIVPARHLGVEQRLGSISVGKDAYLHIVDGNPLEDLTDLFKVEQVIKGRQLYYAPDLLQSQGFSGFVDSP